jgi:Holliday junction resolvase-like predicted endonuclease
MSAMQRNKGRKGQREAMALLRERDWEVAELNAGTASEDLLATDRGGTVWSVEVKNTATITQAHRKQAMAQAKLRHRPWMLMNKIAGTSSYLVQRQGERPTVWEARS